MWLFFTLELRRLSTRFAPFGPSYAWQMPLHYNCAKMIAWQWDPGDSAKQNMNTRVVCRGNLLVVFKLFCWLTLNAIPVNESWKKIGNNAFKVWQRWYLLKGLRFVRSPLSWPRKKQTSLMITCSTSRSIFGIRNLCFSLDFFQSWKDI